MLPVQFYTPIVF